MQIRKTRKTVDITANLGTKCLVYLAENKNSRFTSAPSPTLLLNVMLIKTQLTTVLRNVNVQLRAFDFTRLTSQKFRRSFVD